MTEKKQSILYWVLTLPFCLCLLASGVAYLAGIPKIVTLITTLGYPVYILKILGTAKVLGSLAILTGLFPRMKEWAYAGFTFNLLGASASHALHGDPIGHALVPLALFGLLMSSYAVWKKRPESTP